MNNYGWICPKCGCVLAPFVPECYKCNKLTEIIISTDSTGYFKPLDNDFQKVIDDNFWNLTLEEQIKEEDKE